MSQGRKKDVAQQNGTVTCQYHSAYRRDPSSFLRLRNTINVRQDVREFHPRKDVKDVRDSPPRGSRSSSQRSSRSLGRYILYTGAMVPLTFCGALIWQYENIGKLHRNLRRHFEQQTQKKAFSFREQLNMMWSHFSAGQKTFFGIVALNGIIFCCWRVSSIVPVLSRYFLCSYGNPAVSMTLSAFSHLHLWHIFVNMYVLSSFAPLALQIYGKEQFVAVYLSAATISSLASVILKSARGLMVPSLGASGAVCAILASCCYQNPDIRLAIAFVDQIIPHSFSAKNALIGLIIFDTVGLFMPWSRLDHAAHLGGTLFGLAYMRYGRDLTWDKLGKKFLRFYHSIRKRS